MEVSNKNNQKQLGTRIYGRELLFWGVIELNFVFLLLNHTPARFPHPLRPCPTLYIFIYLCTLCYRYERRLSAQGPASC